MESNSQVNNEPLAENSSGVISEVHNHSEMARSIMSSVWESFKESVDWQESSTQICLGAFLVALVLLTCMYNRHKLNKSSLNFNGMDSAHF